MATTFRSEVPALVLPLHRSMAGYRLVAYSDAATDNVVVFDAEAGETHLVFFNGARIWRRPGRDIYLLVRGGEALAWTQLATDPGPDGKPQTVLPGCGRVPPAELARRVARAPRKPRKPQAPCDIGLFSDDSTQIDVADLLNASPEGK